ncbi:MAG: copper chaperone PCu(A)C [Alphaproteobacteria bacterium]
MTPIHHLAAGLAAILLAALPVPLLAQTGQGPAIEITEPWSRPSPGASRIGTAYLTIRNGGAVPDRLVAASAPVAQSVEIHTVLKDGDVMRMRPVDAIDVAPGVTTTLQPGGYHLMLMGLKAPLKAGDRFPLELKFEKGGTRTVEVRVGSAPAAPKGHEGPTHPGGQHR